ncbi:DUF6770 family protein [Flavobacterium crassostreae]|uniref:Uncharacterized protein n=1 Tax=Flavobacterium crassostreae TaxID=1763534 RepID=A0A1B9E078_9FLAO|nr:DUF6770 family protein [Flavobacterium crassostreae]OCB75334.1 hypothetical protein LPBF_08030 [Flavobacterium crassostreae]
MKKTLLILLFIVQFSFGQSYSVLNQAEGKAVAFVPIVENKELFGYVELREMNTDENLNVTFKYVILDKNMNQICTGEFVEKKLNHSTYTPEKLGLYYVVYTKGFLRFNFRIVNSTTGKSSFLTYKVLNINSNKIVSSGIYNPEIKEVSSDNAKKDKTDYFSCPLHETGFLIYGHKDEKDKRDADDYEMYAVNTNNEKIWEYKNSIPLKKEDSQIYSIHNYNSKYIVLRGDVTSKSGMRITHFVVLDIKTGKQLFYTEIPAHYTHSFEDVLIQDDRLYLMGRYFEKVKGGLYEYDKSLGIFQFVFDLKSQSIYKEKYLSYDKFLDIKMNKYGKIKGEGFLNFNDFYVNPDGSTFIISESFFQKGLNRDYTQLYTFTLDSNFDPVKTNVYDVKTSKESKFKFSQYLPNKIGRAYFFFDKTDNSNLELNIVNYYFKSKKEEISKLTYNTNKSTISIFRAKEGYVGIAEYFKDTKKDGKYMEIRLEKLNYERE